jgi:hypothetical protein
MRKMIMMTEDANIIKGEPFFPATGSVGDWNAAFYRLEDYFRALHLVDKIHQSQIILQLLKSAATRHAQNINANPTELAMEEAHKALEQWFAAVLPPHERLSVMGMLSLFATDAVERWPAAFLAGRIPADFHKEMLESEVRAGPDLQISSMVPRPIDVGSILETLQLAEKLEKVKWGLPVLTALLVLGAVSYSMYILIR